MLKRHYHTVRKECWDQLWHSVYTDNRGVEHYDRVGEAVALEISRRIQLLVDRRWESAIEKMPTWTVFN